MNDGPVIRADQTAVLWDEDAGFTLVLSALHGERPEDEVPDEVIALSAFMLRCDSDPDFLAQQVEWMKAQSVSGPKAA